MYQILIVAHGNINLQMLILPIQILTLKKKAFYTVTRPKWACTPLVRHHLGASEGGGILGALGGSGGGVCTGCGHHIHQPASQLYGGFSFGGKRFAGGWGLSRLVDPRP